MNTSPLRIVFFITGLQTGGAEMMLYKLLSRLDKTRFHPMVISLRSGGSLEPLFTSLGVTVHALDFLPNRLNIRSLFRAAALLRTFKPHLIQGWMYHANLVAQGLAISCGNTVPVLWNIRVALDSGHKLKPITKFIIFLGAILSRLSHGVIYCSKDAQLHHERRGYPQKKSLYIPNGFDLSLFTPRTTAILSSRQIWGGSAAMKVVAIIGRYHPQKDHETFLKCAKLLSSQVDNITFLLIGKNVDLHNQTLMHQIETLGLASSVVLLGERSDISALLHGVDVLVSSSVSEGFSNVIGEAMSCAVPCVVTDVGESRLVLGEDPYVVPPKNPQALADGVMSILKLSLAEREALGQRLRLRMCENFEINHITRCYEEIFEKTIKQGELRCAGL